MNTDHQSLHDFYSALCPNMAVIGCMPPLGNLTFEKERERRKLCNLCTEQREECAMRRMRGREEGDEEIPG